MIRQHDAATVSGTTAPARELILSTRIVRERIANLLVVIEETAPDQHNIIRFAIRVYRDANDGWRTVEFTAGIVDTLEEAERTFTTVRHTLQSVLSLTK